MELLEKEYKTRQFISKTGHTIEIHNKNCLSGMDLYSDDYFDVIVTSPPYNLGVSYGLYDDTIPREEYLPWLEQVAINVKKKMKNNGSFFLNVGASPSNPWGPFEVVSMLRSHFSLQNTIHWIKSIYIENSSYNEKVTLNVGHYKPINSYRFLNDNHEYIFHFTKSGNVSIERLAIGVPYKDEGNINRWKNGINGIRCRGNTWYVPYKTIRSCNKERPHPATFPVEIAKKCIQLHGIKHDMIVLDPFMGIGNTSIACQKLDVNCVGFEIDQKYFETNARLIESEFDKDTII